MAEGLIMAEGEKLEGFELHNMIDPSTIFASTSKSPKMSYRIHDLTNINGSELLKLKLQDGTICRIMKYIDDNTKTPALTFDIVDEVKKEIISKANAHFFNGVGLSIVLLDNNLITQWEIVPTDKICRAFIFGDKNTFLSALEEFNIKLSQSADWYIRNALE